MLPKVRFARPQQPCASACVLELSSDSSDCEGEEPPLKLRIIHAGRRSFCAATKLGISTKEWRSLKRPKAPQDFLLVVHLAHRLQGWVPMRNHIVEMMAGLGHVAASGRRSSLDAETFEILNSPIQENFLCDPGFLYSLYLQKTLFPKAMVHWDTVCSSWIWACRAITKRSELNPMGDTTVEFVIWGNCMVSRMMLCILLTRGKEVVPILEQPLTSVMDGHKRFKAVDWKQVSTWLGLYGATCAKPTKLFSPDLYLIAPLYRKMGRADKDRFEKEAIPVTYSYYKDGRVKTQSFKGNMKKSQQYPVAYADAVVESFKVWKRSRAPLRDIEQDSSDSDYDESSPRSWPEAKLGSLVRELRKRFPDSPGHF